MKRTIRVKLEYLIEIDDDKQGLPPVFNSNICDVIIDGIRPFVPAGANILPGARWAMSLSRESIAETKRRAKASPAAGAWVSAAKGIV